MEIMLKDIKKNEKDILKTFLEIHWKEIDLNFNISKIFLDKYIEFIFNSSNRNLKWIFFKNTRVGFIIYYFYNITPEKMGLHIAEIFVKIEFRRRGIGKKVLYFLEKKYSGMEEFRIEVLKSNEIGFNFWENNNFSIWKYIMKKKLEERVNGNQTSFK